MPRGEARIRVTIWDDKDYTSLTMDEQWLYEALLSQKDLNHAGVLTIPRREWANLCRDEDAADRIGRARKGLEDRRYLVVDDDTDELLVRSYIRRDVESAPPGTFRSAMNSAIAVSSPRIKAVIYKELLRLDTTVVEGKGMANGEKPIDALYRALKACRPSPEDPTSKPVEEPDPEVDDTGQHAMPMPSAWHAPETVEHPEDMACAVDVGRWRQRRDPSPPASTQVDVQSVAPARTHTRAREGRRRTSIDELNRSASSLDGRAVVDDWLEKHVENRPLPEVLRPLYGDVDGLLARKWAPELIIECLVCWQGKGIAVKWFPEVASQYANSRTVQPAARQSAASKTIAGLQSMKTPEEETDEPPPMLLALPGGQAS